MSFINLKHYNKFRFSDYLGFVAIADKVSYFRDCLQMCSIVKNGLELLILLPCLPRAKSAYSATQASPPSYIIMVISKTKENSGGNSDPVLLEAPLFLWQWHSAVLSLCSTSETNGLRWRVRRGWEKKHTAKLPWNYSTTQNLAALQKKHGLSKEGAHQKGFSPGVYFNISLPSD